jgi:hypothetical protein
VITYRRAWLNPLKSRDSGAIAYSYGPSYEYFESEFTMWDCSRKITLDFGFTLGKRKPQQERIKKLNIIIDALTEIRDAIENTNKENTSG